MDSRGSGEGSQWVPAGFLPGTGQKTLTGNRTISPNSPSMTLGRISEEFAVKDAQIFLASLVKISLDFGEPRDYIEYIESGMDEVRAAAADKMRFWS